MYYYRTVSSNAITSLPDTVFANQRQLEYLLVEVLYTRKPILHCFTGYDKTKYLARTPLETL